VANSSAESADAAKNGVSSEMPLSSPPMPGPNVNPSPIDMPTSPIPRVRCSGVVMSAT